MIYRCETCNRFIANIIRLNNLTIKGKSIIMDGNHLKIVCKCGKCNIIDLTTYR